MGVIARGEYYPAPFEDFIECIKREFLKPTFFTTSEAAEKCSGDYYPTAEKYLPKIEEQNKRINGHLRSHKVGKRTIWENDPPGEIVLLRGVDPRACRDLGGYYDEPTDTCLLPRGLGGTLSMDARTCEKAGGLWDKQTRTCYLSKERLS